jgi:hypothetical protein
MGFDSPSRHHLTYLFAIFCGEGKCRSRIPPVQIRCIAYPADFQYFTVSKYGLETAIYIEIPLSAPDYGVHSG